MKQVHRRSVDDGLFGSEVGRPTVIPFGVSADGHFSESANAFLKHLSEIKFGVTQI